jgi:hypothetical protein
MDGAISGSTVTRSSLKARGRRDAPAYDGELLAHGPDGVVGWAWRPNRPDTPVRVVLLSNDHLAGVGIADRFDIPMVQSRVGPGIPGFIITPRDLPGDRDSLVLSLRSEHGDVIGRPLEVVLPRDVASHGVNGASPHRAGTTQQGMILGFRDGALIGWVAADARSGEVPMLELHDGERQVTRQRAEPAGPTPRDAGSSFDRHPFALKLPTSLLDGLIHRLRVTISGGGVELAGGPVAFGPQSVSSLLDEVVGLREQVSKLTAAVDAIVSPFGPLQRQLIGTLCNRIAAFSEIQRDMVERELEALRSLSFATRETCTPGKTLVSSPRKSVPVRPNRSGKSSPSKSRMASSART